MFVSLLSNLIITLLLRWKEVNILELGDFRVKKYLLSIYSVPGSVLHVNRTDPWSHGAYILEKPQTITKLFLFLKVTYVGDSCFKAHKAGSWVWVLQQSSIGQASQGRASEEEPSCPHLVYVKSMGWGEAEALSVHWAWPVAWHWKDGGPRESDWVTWWFGTCSHLENTSKLFLTSCRRTV